MLIGREVSVDIDLADDLLRFLEIEVQADHLGEGGANLVGLDAQTAYEVREVCYSVDVFFVNALATEFIVHLQNSHRDLTCLKCVISDRRDDVVIDFLDANEVVHVWDEVSEVLFLGGRCTRLPLLLAELIHCQVQNISWIFKVCECWRRHSHRLLLGYDFSACAFAFPWMVATVGFFYLLEIATKVIDLFGRILCGTIICLSF